MISRQNKTGCTEVSACCPASCFYLPVCQIKYPGLYIRYKRPHPACKSFVKSGREGKYFPPWINPPPKGHRMASASSFVISSPVIGCTLTVVDRSSTVSFASVISGAETSPTSSSPHPMETDPLPDSAAGCSASIVSGVSFSRCRRSVNGSGTCAKDKQRTGKHQKVLCSCSFHHQITSFIMVKHNRRRPSRGTQHKVNKIDLAHCLQQ